MLKMLRTLSPLGWLLTLAGGLIAVVIAIAVVSSVWNGLWAWWPGSAESKLERAQTELATTHSDATARGLESQGNAEQVARTEAYGDIRIRVAAETAQALNQAQEAPDANDPLSDERAYRLRDHDRRLCDIAPGACAAAAPDDP